MTDQYLIKRLDATFYWQAILFIIGFMFLTPHPSDAADTPAKSISPDFGPNVLVFDPSMKDIQSRLDDVFAKQEAAQFGDGRHAYLFKPGTYDLDVQVGFYTHVAGLGRLPEDAQINGAVRVKAKWMKNNNATCNFWRSAENFAVTPTLDDNVNIWATSQAVSLRRAHIRGDINLWDGGWSSGGFLADSIIDGQLNSGSQQQWLSRNSHFGKWVGGSWNMVFVGCTNPPAGEWPEHPYTVIEKTPLVREKPYMFVDETGRYFVMVPPLAAGRTDVSWKDGKQPGNAISLDDFYIAHAGKDDATTLNAALASGKHLLLTPGIYHLKETIKIARPDAIIFGLGYPTLVADSGQTLMSVADVGGVKICGVLLEAGATESPNLLQVGEPGASASHPENPICLWDLFCRAGGAHAGKASCFVTINSNHVIGDNFWLWRADHGEGAKWEINRNKNGLIVNGSDVTIYGLFVEHTQEYQTIWSGERGRVYFYQSEMPYDPPNEAAWSHDGIVGYASYKVADDVKEHDAWGLGVYCVFYAAPVVAQSAIEAPVTPGVKLRHLVTIRLSGQPNSGIRHVINDQGDSVITKQKAQMK